MSEPRTGKDWAIPGVTDEEWERFDDAVNDRDAARLSHDRGAERVDALLEQALIGLPWGDDEKRRWLREVREALRDAVLPETQDDVDDRAPGNFV